MSNKKILLKKLLDYPNLNYNEYLNLINTKNNININNKKLLEDIEYKINLYLEKELIINMIKCPIIIY